MSVRKSNAHWQGDLKSGKGHMALGSGAWEGQYSFSSRFEEGAGSNPEELIAAAHAGCFSMALSNILAEAGHTPDSVSTEAKVQLVYPVTHLVTYRAPYKLERKAALAGKGGSLCKSANAAIGLVRRSLRASASGAICGVATA